MKTDDLEEFREEVLRQANRILEHVTHQNFTRREEVYALSRRIEILEKRLEKKWWKRV